MHGGGFYHMQKYLVAPPEMPEGADLVQMGDLRHLDLSGFVLLVWVYYLHADLYLIDPAVAALEPWQAAAIGIGALVRRLARL